MNERRGWRNHPLTQLTLVLKEGKDPAQAVKDAEAEALKRVKDTTA